MILVDTSIWIDHIRQTNEVLAALMSRREAWLHPFVLGEIAVGQFKSRPRALEALRRLPQTQIVDTDELLGFIDRKNLAGRGVGFVDIHLIASARLQPGMRIWTRDRRLHLLAAELSLAANLLK